MRIALIHNHYQQPGGEDRVFAAEAALLTAHGHEVITYTVHNEAVNEMSRASVACATVWSRTQYNHIRDLLSRLRPDVVHVHNTLPLISPAVYDAARSVGVPTVHTLHNYRMICPSGLLFREGAPCEACVGRVVPWPGVLHRCYRDNRAATAAVAASLAVNRLRGGFHRHVDRFIALTEFAKSRFVAGGLPADRISVKPNFVEADPGLGDGAGGYALFVGRLSPEKGLDVLLRAWSQLSERIPLRIVGDGPLASSATAAAGQMDGITWLGHLAPAEVAVQMKRAAVLVVPSLSYETFGLVAIEALAVGTPVVASRLGALGEVVDDGRSGWLFEPGNATALAAAVTRIFAGTSETRGLREAARRTYEERYTADRNYEQLLRVYRQAMGA